tara:strand:- start:5893 stop:6651 length:759 start_codon:yes stop_codon:yes gene_type:complete
MIENSKELEKLISICHKNLRNSKECLSYLKNRGLTKDDVKNYKIGYFPRNPSVLTNHVSADFLKKVNLLDYSNNSDFSNYFYLVFPIYSEYGKPIGLSGRTLLDDDGRSIIGIPKYKNSSYKKSNILYGLDQARDHIIKSKNVYVTEGYFDKIAMTRAGMKNCIAICGTAFSQNHFVKLARYTDKITFLLDSDDAGVRSAIRIYNKYLNKGIKLRFLKYPDSYKDIDEYFANKSNSTVSFKKDFKLTIPNVW